jgi:hypothetical protein
LQYALPLFWRQSVEPLEALLKLLLSPRGELLELRIAPQSPFLLLRRQVLIVAKPIAGMRTRLSQRSRRSHLILRYR